jgi:hypothetical protein
MASEGSAKSDTADEVHIEGKRLFRKRRDASVGDATTLNQTAIPKKGNDP